MKAHGLYRVVFNDTWSVESGYNNDYKITALNNSQFEISKLEVVIGIINPGSEFEDYYTSLAHVYNGAYKIHSHNSPNELTVLPDNCKLKIGYYELVVEGETYLKGKELAEANEVGEYYCEAKSLVFSDSTVSDNYIIEFKEADYTILRIKQATLSIVLKEINKQNASKVYDGERLIDISSQNENNVVVSSDVINVDSKVFKHVISADMRYYSTDNTYIVPPKNVGQYKQVITNVYVDGVLLTYDSENGCYFNKNLKIYTSELSTQITPKNIVINISIADQKYDGKVYEVKTKDITFNTKDLAAGDTLTITDLSFVEGEALHAGRYTINPNSVKYTITQLGANVNGNYNITFKGSLTIKPREITISVNDFTMMYTGLDVEIKSYFFTFGKDTISSSFGFKYDCTFIKNSREVDAINEIGTYTLILNDIVDENGNSIENNDDFIFSRRNSIIDDRGEIIIEPYEVVINTGSRTFVHENDSSVYYCYDFDIDYDKSYLIEGHVVTVDEDNSPYLTGRGAAHNTLAFIILDSNGNDVTKNYIIKHGEVGILSVVSMSTIVSNNYYYVGTTDTLELVGNSLHLESDDASLFGAGVILEDYKILNRRGVDCTNAVVETGTGYQLYVKASFMLNGELVDSSTLHLTNEIVDGYYVMDFAVLKRPISIKAKDIITTYSGEKVSVANNDYVITSELQLLEGHYAKINTSLEVVNAGTYVDNQITRVTIYDASGKNVNKYYDIDYSEYSTIQINPVVIYISTSSATYYYDGSSFTSKDFTLHTELLPGHEIAYDEIIYSSKTSVGTTNNHVYLSIKDGDEYVTGNYKVEYTEVGTITVLKSTILVVTGSSTKEYDGEILSCKEYEVYVNGVLIEGTKINELLHIEFVDYAQIVEPGTIENTVTINVKKSSSKVNKYFDITYQFGSLTITLTE